MKIFISISLATVLCTGALYADKPDHAGNGNKEKKENKHREKGDHNNKKQKFSYSEQGKIYSYYRNLPYGLQKKMRHDGKLPPGWQKKVNVGERMPEDYLVYAVPVPMELQSQLSPGPIGTELLQVADRVIRIEKGTNMILEALDF